MPRLSSLRLITALLGLLLSACATPPSLTLMSTPVIYQDAAIDPFAHLTDDERIPDVALFYATNRQPEAGHYGNGVSDQLHLGQSVATRRPSGSVASTAQRLSERYTLP